MTTFSYSHAIASAQEKEEAPGSCTVARGCNVSSGDSPNATAFARGMYMEEALERPRLLQARRWPGATALLRVVPGQPGRSNECAFTEATAFT